MAKKFQKPQWTLKNIGAHNISNLWSLITPSKKIHFECLTKWSCKMFWKFSTYHTLQSKVVWPLFPRF
jgi:hypothetical protein